VRARELVANQFQASIILPILLNLIHSKII
jgi:hypothetical protein